MSQLKKVLSVLLSVVMLLTVIPFSAYAAHADYTQAGGYDLCDDPYVTPAQAASMLLDMVDAMLAEENITVPIDIYVGSKTLDFRSIDQATSSITDFWNWTWVDIAFFVLNFGDIEKMNMHWIENCPKRTQAGTTDMDVVMALVKFLHDNYERIGKIIDDTFNYGFVTRVTTLPAELHDVPGTLKKTVLKKLNNDVDPPPGTTVDALVQQLIEGLLVGEQDPETGKYDGLIPGMRGKININNNAYDFITDLINAAMADVVVPMLSEMLLGLAGVEFSPEYPGGDPNSAENLDMIIGILTEIVGEIPYGPGDLDTPLAQMSAALRYMFIDGGLEVFFYLDNTGLHITQAAVDMIEGLLRGALTLLPGLGVFKNTKDFPTEDEVMAMETPELYAYIFKLLFNEFVEFADIPDSATSVRAVMTHLLIGLAKDVLPETNYDAMLKAGVINPNGDGVFVVGARLAAFYLSGLLPIDIPLNVTFDQLIECLFDWLISEYGGLFYTGNFSPEDTVWQKLDKLIFSIIPNNWLPSHIIGSEYLVKEWLIGNILDFDYVGLLSIIKRNPTSELNGSMVTALLNTVARLLKAMLGNNTILPFDLPSFEAIFTKPNFRAFVQNLAQHLSVYGLALFGDLFPLITQLIGIWSKETYIRKAPAGTPMKNIQELQDLADSYTPRNLNEELQYFEPGYHFFGPEDFTELRNYYNFKEALDEVNDLIAAYNDDPESLNLQANTDAAYRLTYYYNKLVMRSELCVTQLTNEIIRTNDMELIAENYTVASWNDFQIAYNFAMKVRGDAITHMPGIRQSTISAARQHLFKAVKALADFQPYADYSQLDLYINEAINTLDNLPDDQFTPESIQALIDALAIAQGLNRTLTWEEQATVDSVAAQLYSAIYGLAYILAPALNPIPNSVCDFWGNMITPVINPTRRFIYGLAEGGYSSSYFTTVGGASTSILPASQGMGTGTKVRLMFQGMRIAEYLVVLFGDVNGDGNIDDGDGGQVIDYENLLYDWVRNPEKRFAADVNGDGNIDAIDAAIISNCMNYILTIDQTTGEVTSVA